jgi:hypothetical protein
VPLYSVEAFRGAFAVQYLVVGLGVVALLIARRSTRRDLQATEGIVVGSVWIAYGHWLRRRALARRRNTPTSRVQL